MPRTSGKLVAPTGTRAYEAACAVLAGESSLRGTRIPRMQVPQPQLKASTSTEQRYLSRDWPSRPQGPGTTGAHLWCSRCLRRKGHCLCPGNMN